MSQIQPQRLNLNEFVKTTPVPRITVLGFTGSGKTFFCKRLISMYLKQKKKIYVIDVKNEFSTYKIFQNSDLERFPSFIRRFLKIKVDGKVYDNPDIVLDFVSQLCWETPPSILYVEEIPELVAKHESLPNSHPYLYKCLQQGRARNVGVISVSQMSADLHMSFLKQSTDIFIFKMRPMELSRLEEIMGFPKDSLNFTFYDENNSEIDTSFHYYHLNKDNKLTFNYPLGSEKNAEKEEND